MSPIERSSIIVEKWTPTGEGRLYTQQRTQVLAKGDKQDPGLFVYERGVLKENVHKVKTKSGKRILDIRVDYKTGEIIDGYGVWRKYKDQE